MGSKALSVLLLLTVPGCAQLSRTKSPEVHESVFLGLTRRETIEWAERSDGVARVTSIENSPWQVKAEYVGTIDGNGIARLTNVLNSADVRQVRVFTPDPCHRSIYTIQTRHPKGEWVVLELVTDGSRLTVERDRVPKGPYYWSWR